MASYISYNLDQISDDILIPADVIEVSIYQNTVALPVWEHSIKAAIGREREITLNLHGVNILGNIDIFNNNYNNKLLFEEESIIESRGYNEAAIHVGDNCRLSIYSNGGTLNAKASIDGAAIGGNNGENGGDICIFGKGNIISSSINGAAIGGGSGGNGGVVSIYGPIVVYANSTNGDDIGKGLGGNEGYILISDINNVKKSDVEDIDVKSKLMRISFKDMTYTGVYAGNIYLFDGSDIGINIYGRTNKNGDIYIHMTAGKTCFFRNSSISGWCQTDNITFLENSNQEAIFYFIKTVWLDRIEDLNGILNSFKFNGNERIYIYFENATDYDKNYSIIIPDYIKNIALVGKVVMEDINNAYRFNVSINAEREDVINVVIDNLNLITFTNNGEVFVDISTVEPGSKLIFSGESCILSDGGKSPIHVVNSKNLIIISENSSSVLGGLSNSNAAGIGGNAGESSGNIILNGTGNLYAIATGSGAGIGGGNGGNGGNIVITDGLNINVTGSNGADDIGKGLGGNDGYILIANVDRIKCIEDRDINILNRLVPLLFNDCDNEIYSGDIYLYKKTEQIREYITYGRTNKSGKAMLYAPDGSYFFRNLMNDVRKSTSSIFIVDGSIDEKVIKFNNVKSWWLSDLSQFTSDISNLVDINDKWVYIYLERAANDFSNYSLNIPNNVERLVIVGQVESARRIYDASINVSNVRLSAMNMGMDNLNLRSKLANGVFVDIAKNALDNILWYTGENCIKSSNSVAGIHTGPGTSLKIYSQSDVLGTLQCDYSYSDGAGIGGNALEAAGTIRFLGDGFLNLVGNGLNSGYGAAGIGGGRGSDGGNKTVSGGIKISAESCLSGACIGGGYDGNGGDMLAFDRPCIWADQIDSGAAIGGGCAIASSQFVNGDGGNIQFFHDVKVRATNKGNACAIGGGYRGNSGNISIEGNTNVRARAQVSQRISDRDEFGNAAIGSATGKVQGRVLITMGARVTAESERGAAVGSGKRGAAAIPTEPANAMLVMISGDAEVSAVSMTGAGIGGGEDRDGGEISILDRASVFAQSTGIRIQTFRGLGPQLYEHSGAGIGGGYMGGSGNVWIQGTGAVIARGNVNDVGAGEGYVPLPGLWAVFIMNSNNNSSIQKPVNPRVAIEGRGFSRYKGPVLIRTTDGVTWDEYTVSTDDKGEVSLLGNFIVTVEIPGRESTRSQEVAFSQSNVPSVMYLKNWPSRGLNIFNIS
ncbi:MAG: hypothetical protein E6929_12255 [Clostridium sp.]|nr:hypothetical protein [Clostridium sp.]